MTFIQCKMINDMSRLAGKETEFAEITQRAMDGKIQFNEALQQRVALLKCSPQRFGTLDFEYSVHPQVLNVWFTFSKPSAIKLEL